MKKHFLPSLLAGTLALTLGVLFAAPASAVCPVKAKCKSECEKPSPVQCEKPVQPKDPKCIESRKAEFEARLNLTKEQKAKLEKIKADEKKALAPYEEKIKQEQEKLNNLHEKQMEIRKNSLTKFDELLTEEQRAELEKIKQEIQEELKQMHPDCGCKCHHPETKSLEPADCKCPCHKPQPCPEPKAVK